MKSFLRKKFEDFREEGRNGINSVQIEKFFKSLGYKITRKSVDVIAKAEIIKKPSEINFVKGKGRRVEYDFESVVDILMYCIISDVIPGIGKGMAVFDRHLLLAEAKKIAEIGDSDLKTYMAYANIAALLSARNVIPYRVPIAKRISSATSIRALLYRVSVLYKFLLNWLKVSEGDVLEDWCVLRKSFITSKNIKNFYKNGVQQMFSGSHTNNETQLIEETMKLFRDVDDVARKDLIAWCEIIIIFNNSNGFIGQLAKKYLESKHGLTVFGTSNDWFIAFNILMRWK